MDGIAMDYPLKPSGHRRHELTRLSGLSLEEQLQKVGKAAKAVIAHYGEDVHPSKSQAILIEKAANELLQYLESNPDPEVSRAIKNALALGGSFERLCDTASGAFDAWLRDSREASKSRDRTKKFSNGGQHHRFDPPKCRKWFDDAVRLYGTKNVSELVRRINDMKDKSTRRFGRTAVENELARRGLLDSK
ncbi:hypothetical protein NG895_05340 [Aeoliella sp. ICT_H6.2]|uniref:Uncharacterized protein n=1 Tax=Aeoliella straminimaris TaxID=2954799 RepID=A0A9X2FBK2_9BACT|nr:hypothetical protein [Aeoliella straminimaris]MCO6043324.1 hypothetical protein [Aeoliella straminimaris]